MEHFIRYAAYLQRLANQKILVVDDDFDIIYIIRKHLEKWGYDVDTFTNPLYALEQFKANQDRYSLALIDINMPEISGIALASKMLKVKPDFKVIIMTAYEIIADNLRDSLPKMNTDDILKKPFTITQVCTSVKKHLATA